MGDDDVLQRFLSTRAATEALAAPLGAEDQMLQASADSSPTKWHRAHTTWFFATFVLAPHAPDSAALRPSWNVLFNSYYEAAGPRHPRPQRGLLSRPTLDEVARWRADVDDAVARLWTGSDDARRGVLRPLLELGIAHEEQHQELLLSDIVAAFFAHPLKPAWRAAARPTTPTTLTKTAQPAAPAAFVDFAGGLVEVGVDVGVDVGPDAEPVGFCFDNEGPRHKVFLPPFSLGNDLVTVGALRAFIDDGGYRTPALWLSEGWSFVQTQKIEAPGYCRVDGGALVGFDLGGERLLDDHEPVAHLSYYEADALARFLGARLPTEAEWEHACGAVDVDDHSGCFRDDVPPTTVPTTATAPTTTTKSGLRQMLGTCWEWTQSAYAPYPGYQTPPGALGEYNGKFMVSQLVLRGGSSWSNRGHLRPTYRNFWPAPTRFQRSGIRLARDRR